MLFVSFFQCLYLLGNCCAAHLMGASVELVEIDVSALWTLKFLRNIFNIWLTLALKMFLVSDIYCTALLVECCARASSYMPGIFCYSLQNWRDVYIWWCFVMYLRLQLCRVQYCYNSSLSVYLSKTCQYSVQFSTWISRAQSIAESHRASVANESSVIAGSHYMSSRLASRLFHRRDPADSARRR